MASSSQLRFPGCDVTRHSWQHLQHEASINFKKKKIFFIWLQKIKICSRHYTCNITHLATRCEKVILPWKHVKTEICVYLSF